MISFAEELMQAIRVKNGNNLQHAKLTYEQIREKVKQNPENVELPVGYVRGPQRHSGAQASNIRKSVGKFRKPA